MADRDIRCRWSVTVPPTNEPISLEEAKDHARIGDDNSNTILGSYIQTAREACEQYMGRRLLTQTMALVLDDFADYMPLPYAAPLQSVSSITYYDVDGNQQTLATMVYDVDDVARPAEVVLKPGAIWPQVQTNRFKGAVTITYVVGWSSPDDVPERIKQGLRQYLAYLDADRDGMDSTAALAAKTAAERHWNDQVFWTPPRWCRT